MNDASIINIKEYRILTIDNSIINKQKGQITIYPPMIWLKFKMPTCGLKFDTLSTYGLIEI